MGRTISSLIKLSWTEAQVLDRAKAMVAVCEKILFPQKTH